MPTLQAHFQLKHNSMTIKGITFPDIKIANYRDIDLLVEYFNIHKDHFKSYVDRWLKDNMHKNYDLLYYYRTHIEKTIERYNSIENHNNDIFREKEYYVKWIRDEIVRLNASIKAFSTKKQSQREVCDYKILRIAQPLATMLVYGIIDHLKAEELNKFNKGERVIVFAEAMNQETLHELWSSKYLYSHYLNSQVSGNMETTLTYNSYIGVLTFGPMDIDGTHYIEDARAFTVQKTEIPQHLFDDSLYKHDNNFIKLEERTIKVPIGDEPWKNLHKFEGEVFFYWMPYFDKFYSDKYGFGDKFGKYDILFCHGSEQMRFVQNNLHVITREEYVLDEGNFDFMALVFHFGLLKGKSFKGSSFDILNKKEWILDWRCVKFKSGYFVILPPEDKTVIFKPKAFVYPQVVESYNYLREYLNERLDPIRCYVHKMQIEIYDKFKLDEAIGRFATATKQRAIRTRATNPIKKDFVPSQMSFKQALSKAQKMTEEEFHKYKSKYIDFLVTQQSESYKIIPCVEKLSYANNDSTEYSFIFSVKCRNGNIMVVHENVNPDRSTLIFIVHKMSFKEAIREIYDFLQGAEINKRSSLRSGSVSLNRKMIIAHRSVNHEDLNTWKRSILSYKQIY